MLSLVTVADACVQGMEIPSPHKLFQKETLQSPNVFFGVTLHADGSTNFFLGRQVIKFVGELGFSDGRAGGFKRKLG